ncbi:MAG TPA: hypothetical protein VGP93_12645 [Polyangiaceae bacterium]|nr:hypothetical protein [Polyangiaceae bacterium]
MAEIRPVLEAVFNYVKAHPEELLRALRNALALRFGVPIVALRWLAVRVKSKKAPKDVEIEAVPPGVRIGATIELMGTPVRASAVICVERVSAGPDELRLEVRLSQVALKVMDDNAQTPVAALLRSGALDLSKPGNLAAYMPKRPAMLVEAKDDLIVLDLMRHPKLAKDARLRRAVGLVVPLVTVAAIETDPEHLDVALRAFPEGLGEVLNGIKRAL